MKRIIQQTMQHLPSWSPILPRGGVACSLLPLSEIPVNENQEGDPRGTPRREFRVSGMKCACTKIVSATILTTNEVVSNIMRSESRKAFRIEQHYLPHSRVLWIHLGWLSCWWISVWWESDDGTAYSSRLKQWRKPRTVHTAVAIGVPTVRGHYARSIRYGCFACQSMRRRIMVRFNAAVFCLALGAKRGLRTYESHWGWCRTECRVKRWVLKKRRTWWRTVIK
jgi:hypothetical protein